MRKYKLTRYLAILFIAVVIVPAVVLSLLAIRAVSHEEAYIEKQLEGTLLAEVTHATLLVNTEMTSIQTELANTVPVAPGADPSDSLEEWRARSSLVEIPFLLSPSHEILWPAARQRVGTKEASFAEEQQAFFSGEVEVPVYENIALAYKEEILRGTDERVMGEPPEDEDVFLVSADKPSPGKDTDREAVMSRPAEIKRDSRVAGTGSVFSAGEPEPAGREPVEEVTAASAAAEDEMVMGAPAAPEAGAKRQDITAFRSSVSAETSLGVVAAESPQPKAGSRPSEQELAETGRPARHFTLADEPSDLEPVESKLKEDMPEEKDTKDAAPSPAARRIDSYGEYSRSQQALSQFSQSEPVRMRVYEEAEKKGREISYRNVELPLEHEDVTQELKEVEELKSMFISESLNFSEIVAGAQNGIIPRIIDEQLTLLYWQKIPGGNIVGCLIDRDQFRDRIIGALPGIYSPVRILTVLDENSNPLIVPHGQEDREWRRPFVAQEISELLPRWEAVAYLTNPDVISSRAQVATSVMWILIMILFISIVSGGALVLRSAYAEVKLAQQKTTFVANVSHELKTPLTSIRMFAEMLREGRQPDEAKRKHYLDIMTSETERLTRLINNVLDFSRMGQDKKQYTMKVCNIVTLCASVVESQRARLENNGFAVTFTTEVEQTLIRADEEAVKQSIVNLLSNAEKYSAKVRQIDVNIRHSGRSVLITISDRGIGIPAEEAEKIFDEFYRVDDGLTSRARGTGLGLTIARRIARDHGGDIYYRARDGGGSTFELTLPIAEERS